MIVELKNVCKSYPGSKREILSGIHFQIEKGERIALVGPSGSGKSTLLNIVGTLDEPDSGEVVLFGKDASKLEPEARAALRAQEIGFVFQLHHLLPQSTVLENVLIPRLAKGAGGIDAEVEQRAKFLLERVGMADHRFKFPSQLSGGERQRAAVVRALINRPRLLLADEPTGSLDSQSARDLIDLLTEINEEEGTSLLLVTHDPQQAARIGKRVSLDDGKLTEISS